MTRTINDLERSIASIYCKINAWEHDVAEDRKLLLERIEALEQKWVRHNDVHALIDGGLTNRIEVLERHVTRHNDMHGIEGLL